MRILLLKILFIYFRYYFKVKNYLISTYRKHFKREEQLTTSTDLESLLNKHRQLLLKKDLIENSVNRQDSDRKTKKGRRKKRLSKESRKSNR